MDAIADPANLEVWVMKSAQVGWTEILNNVLGFYIHQDPSPILRVDPTLDMAEAWSKDRFAPMLRDTPALHGLVKDARARDSGNTLLHKQFPGGHVTAAGANSPASLAARPVRVVMCDDVDRFPPSAGAEGDPIRLGQKRSTTFWNRRFLAGSTPTVKGASRIERGYDASDKRRYFVPCTHCGTHQVLAWKNVRWPEGEPSLAHYVCEVCGAEINDGDRAEMVRKGEWRATAPFRGIAGFHIWEAYSPWRTLAEIVADFLEAKKHPETLKVWVNTALGETWEEKGGERLNAEILSERATSVEEGGYATWTVPEGAVMAVAGGDTQHDRVEVGVYAFGPGEECWTVAHEVIFGAPLDPKTWQGVDDLLERQVRRADGLGLPIGAFCIDASDGATAGFVLDYCRTRGQRNVRAIKGQSQSAKPPIGRPTKVDVRKNGVPIPGGAKLWPVGSDTIKGILMPRLREEGYVHFPEGLLPAYFEQLVAERMITKFRNGVPYRIWEKERSARNEALDCFVYAYAAACSIGLKRANWKALASRLKPWSEAPPASIEVTAEHTQRAKSPLPVSGRSRQRTGFGSDEWVL